MKTENTQSADNTHTESGDISYSTEKPENFKDLIKTLKQGFRCQFNDGDDVIECWGSGFNGEEVISFNGEVVSTLTNKLKRQSLHRFNRGGHEYEVEYNLVSIWQGELNCVVIKDGVHLGTKTVRPPKMVNKKPWSWKKFLQEIVIYGALGYAVGYFFAHWFSDDKDGVSETANMLIDPFMLFFS